MTTNKGPVAAGDVHRSSLAGQRPSTDEVQFPHWQDREQLCEVLVKYSNPHWSEVQKLTSIDVQFSAGDFH